MHFYVCKLQVIDQCCSELFKFFVSPDHLRWFALEQLLFYSFIWLWSTNAFLPLKEATLFLPLILHMLAEDEVIWDVGYGNNYGYLPYP